MKCASIDIGTNTVLLLIGDFRDGHLEEICDVSTITRLGEGLKQTGVLSEAAMERTFAALKEYRGLTWEHRVEKVYCVGTAALREARNSEAFLKKVKNELGISIRVISAREEAYYTYLSVKYDPLLNVDQFIIIDPGGGSTEIIKGDRKGFIDYTSLPVGSVKLTEQFIKKDPPAEDELNSLTLFLKDTIATTFDCRGFMLVGTAGTVTTLASIILGLETYKKEIIHGFHISVKETGDVIERLKGLTIRERVAMRVIERGREDIILQGGILVKELMDYFDAQELVVSAHGVRYGIIFEEMG
ncbi:MAG: Ppx/GppA family phosphatase [Syntrophus sp. (in: bacteria)]|nr:Ppx/GppA family phosphatase [Syntrophus sp. (in: bacteria)]